MCTELCPCAVNSAIMTTKKVDLRICHQGSQLSNPIFLIGVLHSLFISAPSIDVAYKHPNRQPSQWARTRYTNIDSEYGRGFVAPLKPIVGSQKSLVIDSTLNRCHFLDLTSVEVKYITARGIVTKLYFSLHTLR
jgi:hypothetical protein